MQPDVAAACIILVHIPKTGGLTMARVIERHYEPGQILVVKSRSMISRLDDLPESQKARLRFVRGHVPFGLHTRLPQHSTYVTMLRNPIERVLSLYSYVRSDREHTLHEQVVRNELTLEQYVRSDISREQVEDGQVRLLSGSPLDPDEDALETAKANLARFFSVVGVTERFDETMILLRRAFGWRSPVYFKRNVTKERVHRRDVPRHVVALIEEKNSLDVQLYEFARRLFYRAVAENAERFRRELGMLRLINTLYAPPVSAARVARGVVTRLRARNSTSAPPQ